MPARSTRRAAPLRRSAVGKAVMTKLRKMRPGDYRQRAPAACPGSAALAFDPRPAAAGPFRPRSLARLLPQLVPIIEPLLDLALEAAVDRAIEGLPRQRVGEIVLTGEAFLRVGIVDIALAIAEPFHQPRRPVDPLQRPHRPAALLGGALRLAEGHVGRHRFGR